MLHIKYAKINGATVVTKEFRELVPDIDKYPPAEAVIEYASRLCYNSCDKFGTNDVFLKGLIKAGHMDVFEHAALSVIIDYKEYDPDIYFSVYEEAFNLLRVMPYLRFEIDSDYDRITVCGNLRSLLEMTEMKMINDLHRMLRIVFDSALAIVAPHIHTLTIDEKERPFWLLSTLRDEYERIQLAELDKEDLGLSIENYTDTGATVTTLGYMGGVASKDNRHSTYLINDISRAASHQLVRHRLLSFCLSGDTVLQSFASKKWTIKELYDWSLDYKRSGRLKLIRLRGRNELGEIVPVTIKNIVHSGKQQVYKLTTKSGRTICSTSLHQFLTPNGWVRLGDLAIGDILYSNGIEAYKDPDYLRQKYLIENIERKTLANEIGICDSTLGKWIKKFGLQKPKSQYPNRVGNPNGVIMTQEVKNKISEKMSGDKNHKWKGDDISDSGGRGRANKLYEANECSECGSTDRVHRHHIDGNPKNNSQDNIIILCEEHHQAWHRFGKRLCFKDEIVSIEIDEIVDTYDIEINEDIHNFVANGIVVHNSQMSQRYVDFTKQGNGFVIPTSPNHDVRDAIWYHFQEAKELYEKLRKLNVRKEDARVVLPNATITHLVFSTFGPGMDHFLKLRTAPDAQEEIRLVALKIEQYEKERYKWVI